MGMETPAQTLGSSGRMLLGAVAQIQPGYFFRGRIRSTTDGTHYLLQAKDVSPQSGIRPDSLIRFVPERNAELYAVSRGDILMAARGERHWVYLVREELKNVLASSVFYVLRPRPELIRPGYLAWWLGLPGTRAALGVMSQGTGIRYIDRSALDSLLVKVPAMSVQERIEKIDQLRRQEAALRSSIEDRREELIQAACLRALDRN